MKSWLDKWKKFLDEGYSHHGYDDLGSAKPPPRVLPGDPEIKGDSVFKEPFSDEDRNEEEKVKGQQNTGGKVLPDRGSLTMESESEEDEDTEEDTEEDAMAWSSEE